MSSQDSTLVYTPVDEIAPLVRRLRATFHSGRTRPLTYRKDQLKALAYLLDENKDAICAAIKADLGKPGPEAILSELGLVKGELLHTISSLDSWAKPDRPWPGMAWVLHRPHIRKDPQGTVLIISPWNYPLGLSITPLIGAIAAGNTAILKPSEVSANTSKILSELFPKYLDPDAFAIVNGAVKETTELLDQRFEHYFFTGNQTVGKIVAEKAAKWLGICTLELGGKSPCIIDSTVTNMRLVARRIAWGKVMNVGQTCVAPDYIYVHRSVQDSFIKEFRAVLEEEYYGDVKGDIKASESYGRIINGNHFNRLKQILDDTKGEIVFGGDVDPETKYFSPTVIKNVNKDDSLMKGELFGPLFPIMTFDNIEEPVNYINSNDQPLVIYVFTNNSKNRDFVFNNTRSGGAVANDTLVHFTIPSLPFGGTGPSGNFGYHGKHTFELFSHHRSTVIAPTLSLVEKALSVRYPPYTFAKVGMALRVVGVAPNLPFSKPNGTNDSKAMATRYAKSQ